MEWLADPGIWASFVTLAALEIVLGIDNLVFIALLAGRLRRDSAIGRASWVSRWRLAHALSCSDRSSGWCI
jgi:predicted tellurium resistance membrane protein TerC